MAEKRSLFEMIFGRPKQAPAEVTQLKMLSGYNPTFIPFGVEPYNSDVVRAAVDAIARNGAKLTPKHIRRIDGQIVPQNSRIQTMLRTRPNPYMNSYDFFYKVITLLCMQNNAFVFIDRNDDLSVNAIYPIPYSTLTILESGKNIYLQFSFIGGQTIAVPYENIIHLRRFFYKHDLLGEPNDAALTPTLELIHTTDEGMMNAIKSSASLRGILKFSSAMMKPEDMKKQRDLFVKEYLSIDNQGGIGAVDAKADFIPLDSKPVLIDDKQMATIKQKVYDYFGVNEQIVTSHYTEEEWNAFYESVLEPISVQMGLEFTTKLFSERELGFGNEIIFESNRLQYASVSSKVNLINNLMQYGILSINEAREILNMGPVEKGDRRLQSLNYINIARADEYQNGGGEEDAGDTEA